MNSAEHINIPTGTTLHTPAGPLDGGTTHLPVQMLDAQSKDKTHLLSYGQIIALGGDFYGDAAQPISSALDPAMQFKENFNTLANDGAVASILGAMKAEWTAIEAAKALGTEPSGAYSTISVNSAYVVAAGPRYLELAQANFDHFGADAVAAYRTGHLIAQNAAAAAAAVDPNPAARLQGLLKAYAINAFADHFLTDLFAGGHVRTPRRALDAAVSAAIPWLSHTIAGLGSKLMHDEDNKFGIWVANARGDSWVAFGDARYGDTLSTANRIISRAAVQRSIDDIWDAFSGKDPDPAASAVLELIPSLALGVPADPGASRDWVPLFLPAPDNGISCRESIDDIGATARVPGTQWTGYGEIPHLVATVLDTASRTMPRDQYSAYPPDESRGALGWPRLPGGADGARTANGPTLAAAGGWTWSIDGPGPGGLDWTAPLAPA